MPRLGRFRAAPLLGLLIAVAGYAAPAAADHCPPIDNPDPVPGQNTTYCHTPQPTEAPDTPRPTAKPTTAPTSAPRTAAPAPVGPTRTSGPSTPQPTPFDIEVPEDEVGGDTNIEVDPEGIDAEFDVVEEAGSTSNTIIGFIVGFFVGGLFGRMSWGWNRRKRRQQIFG
jgi:hypothetical protein